MSAEHALLNKLRASAETLLAAKRAAKPSSKSQEVLLGESSAVLMELRGVVAGTLAAHASGEEAVERAKADDVLVDFRRSRRHVDIDDDAAGRADVQSDVEVVAVEVGAVEPQANDLGVPTGLQVPLRSEDRAGVLADRAVSGA
jgi:hypothetical protein